MAGRYRETYIYSFGLLLTATVVVFGNYERFNSTTFSAIINRINLVFNSNILYSLRKRREN